MQSPIAGGLSGARKTVSASSVLSRPVLGSSLSREIASIADRDTAAVLEQNQVALQNVSDSISRIGSQMILLNNTLLNISGLVSQNAALENLKAQQQDQQERILAEQKLREGKESIIERKMQSVLAAPVQKIGQKAQFSLMNLMSFFNQLFFGWLLNQGIQTIVALSEDNGEKLNEIKDNVLRNLRDVGLTLLALQSGFGLFRGGLLRIGTRIAQAVALQLFRKPIKALLDQVTGIAKVVLPEPILNWLKLSYAYLIGKTDVPSGDVGTISPAENLGGLTGGGAEEAPSEETPTQFVAKSAGGLVAFNMGMRVAGAGPAWLKVLSGLTFSVLGADIASGIAGRLTGASEQAAETSSDAAATTQLKPEEGKTDAAATISAAKVSAPDLKDKAQSIPETPKVKPKVTVVDSSQNGQQQAATQSKMGLANRTPNVSSSNPDNPYPLFSIVTYNVPSAVG